MLATYLIIGFLLFNLQFGVVRFHDKKHGNENRSTGNDFIEILLISAMWPIVIPLSVLVAVGYGIQWVIIKGLETVTTTRKTKLTTTTSSTSER